MTAVPQPWNDEVVRVSGISEREFHEFSVRYGVYCVPVDLEEEERMDGLHDILLQWSPIGRLIYPTDCVPISVLDCGCGSGAWTKQVLEEYEDCEVYGVDLYIERDFSDQATIRWNLNAPFRLAPSELARNRYNLINSRFLASGIDRHRWPGYIQDMFGRLRSGGWLQMTEAYMNIQSSSGRRDEAPNIGRWWDLYSTALEQQGKDPRVAIAVANIGQRAWVNLGSLMVETGFINVETEMHQLPIGEWPSDSNSREIGARVVEVTAKALKAHGVWACCKVHSMTEEAFALLMDGCVREMENPSLKLYIQICMVWGQKPHRDQLQGRDQKDRSSKPSSGQSMPPPSWTKQ